MRTDQAMKIVVLVLEGVFDTGLSTVLDALTTANELADLGPVDCFRRLNMRSTATGATVCFSRLELTLHGSPALCLAADVVVLPLHTRHRHRQHATTCFQHY